MSRKSKLAGGLKGELHEVKNAGFAATKKVKRDKTVNRRAGLHDKLKKSDGEVRVKRCKPLAIKHVRRMRKVAAVFAVGIVGVAAIIGVGFFAPKPDRELNQDFRTVLYESPADGSRPTDHTLVENVGYMNYVLQNQGWWSSEMFSTVTAMGFNQTVETYKQYYDGVLISADVAKGFSSKATQFCVADGVVLWRPSANTNFDKMNTPWSTGEAQGMTVNTYKMKRGFPPSEFSVYVLNEKTITNAYDYTVTDNFDGTYTMSLNLNVNTGDDETSADYYYKLQMKVTGDLYDCPQIKSTTVSYTFTADWKILSFAIRDEYVAPVALGVNIGCTSETNVVFDYDEINAKNTFWKDYFSGEYDRLKDGLVDGATPDDENKDNALGYLTAAFAGVLNPGGAVLKVDVSFDDLNLNGAVFVEMDNGSLGTLRAKIGDFLIFMDGGYVYIDDGNAKYKLNIDGLIPSGEQTEEEGPSDDFLADLMNMMTEGEFALDEATGVATLKSELSLFGLDLVLNFEFLKSETGITLTNLNARIPVGEKVLNANLCFGDESDKPAIPEDTTGYTDILNDGIAFDISLKINNLALDGVAKVYFENGGFTGLYITLADLGIYYDCPRNMLYLSVGELEYKLDLSALGEGGFDFSGLIDGLDIDSLLNDIIKYLSADKDGISTALKFDIKELQQVLGAKITLKLNGGLGVKADLSLGGVSATLEAGLHGGEIALPDLTEYEDILNSDITLNVALTLFADVPVEGELEELTLNGKVTLVLKDGALTEVRADFGIAKVYYCVAEKTLFIDVDGIKIKVDLPEFDAGSFDFTSIYNSLGIDAPLLVKDLLQNLTTTATAISGNASVSVFDGVLPLSAKIDFADGLTIEGGAVLFGMTVNASVSLSPDAVEPLAPEDKETFCGLSENLIEMLLGKIDNRISAEVGGELYTYDYDKEEYARSYSFTASVEFDGTSETDLYIHLSLGLDAVSASKDDVYFDFLIKEEKVFISLSKYAENGNPMKMYMPLDEFANVVSMVCAMANINGLSFGDNEEIATAFNQIYALLNSFLKVDERLGDTAVKFASLGESLIPQLFSSIVGASGEGGNSEDFELNFSAKYVTSLGTKTYEDGKSGLVLVLNSAAMYGSDDLDDLTVELFRNDSFLLSGASVKNVYFGNANENRLGLNLSLTNEFDKVETPNVTDYFNLMGIDELLKTFVNSATHATTKEEYEAGATTEYLLNTEYYIDGKITLSILGSDINVNVNNFFVAINDDNSVEFNVSISYPKVSIPLILTVIETAASVDITVKDEMVYIRKTTDGGKTYGYRIMTTDAFTADMMGQMQYIFSFSDKLMNMINGGDGGGSVALDDYGDYLSKLIASYSFTENNGAANWTVGIGKDFINGFVGMSLLSENVSVKINAVSDASGEAYKFNSLSLSSKLFSIIGFSAELNYRNAQYVWDNGIDLSGNVVKLESDKNYGIGGYSWTEILGGTTLEEICKTVNWTKLLRETSGSTYLEYNGSNLQIGTLKYEYATDINDTEFVEFGTRQTVLYGTNGVYTVLNKPTIDGVMKPVANGDDFLVGSWNYDYVITDETDHLGAVIAMRAEYGAVTLTIVSEQLLNDALTELGFTAHGWQDDGYYVYTKTFKYDENSVYTLDGLSNLPGYVFNGFYDSSTGEKVESFVADSSKMLYIDWVGKTVNITYSSDISVSGATKADGVYTVGGNVKYGANDALRTPVPAAEGVNFLGWFLETETSYIYIESSEALKDYLEQNYFNSPSALNEESVSVTLWSVWYNNVTVTITKASKSWGTWSIGGSYTGGDYASAMSISIAEKAGIARSVQVRYEINGSAEHCDGNDVSDKLNSGSWYNLTGDSFSKSTMTTLNGASYGGARVKVTFSVDGKTLATPEHSNFKSK